MQERKGILDQWPSTKRQILLELKEKAHLTVNQLSDLVGVTHMAIRKHLDGLAGKGLVCAESVRQKRGHPVFVYRLTPSGHALFPRGHQHLVKDLLVYTESRYGQEEVDRFLQARSDRLRAQYATRMTGKNLHQRVETLADLMDADGHVCRWEPEGEDVFTLVEHHCPLLDVARAYPQMCRYEQELFAHVLDAEVTQESHMASGASQCRYRIRGHVARKADVET